MRFTSPVPQLTRFTLLALTLAIAAGCTQMPSKNAVVRDNGALPPDPLRVVEADIPSLTSRMARGEITSAQLTQTYLDRIARLDDAGPRLNAVIEINPNALTEAGALDAERQAGKLRGPLHGIPVLLKDNIDATPMANSAGSLALAAHRPAKDAPLTAALRNAGAVILGKTNLSEWANFRSSHSVSGWSARGGLTRNPYALDRTACGSSSGTAVAIAANLAVVGVGTETDGSIICPSAMNGLVGLKPTVGLISRVGIIPIAQSQDTPGPMTRTVADAARLLSALVAADAGNDDAAKKAGKYRLPDYTTALNTDALEGARIGLVRPAGVTEQADVAEALARTVQALRTAGASITDVTIPTEGRWNDAELTVLQYEFKDGLERYLRESGAPVKSLSEIIAFNRAHAGEEMAQFGQDLFEQANDRGTLKDAAYKTAARKAKQLAGAQGIDAVLKRYKLDALIAPATGPAFLIDEVNGDYPGHGGFSAAAVAGYPSLTVPMGNAHGLPLGLVFMGPKWSESELISLGYAFEQLTQARVAPQFKPSAAP